MFEQELLNNIGDKFKQNGWSVAVAESVTAGLMQAAFSTVKEAAKFFQGGITAYNVGQKCRHLLVDPLHALACDSVSSKVAQDMSLQACKMFSSKFGLASTGYAAPVPEKNINELFCFYSIAEDNTILNSGLIKSTESEGINTQLFFVHEILQRLFALINSRND